MKTQKNVPLYSNSPMSNTRPNKSLIIDPQWGQWYVHAMKYYENMAATDWIRDKMARTGEPLTPYQGKLILLDHEHETNPYGWVWCLTMAGTLMSWGLLGG